METQYPVNDSIQLVWSISISIISGVPLKARNAIGAVPLHKAWSTHFLKVWGKEALRLPSNPLTNLTDHSPTCSAINCGVHHIPRDRSSRSTSLVIPDSTKWSITELENSRWILKSGLQKIGETLNNPYAFKIDVQKWEQGGPLPCTKYLFIKNTCSSSPTFLRIERSKGIHHTFSEQYNNLCKCLKAMTFESTWIKPQPHTVNGRHKTPGGSQWWTFQKKFAKSFWTRPMRSFESAQRNDTGHQFFRWLRSPFLGHIMLKLFSGSSMEKFLNGCIPKKTHTNPELLHPINQSKVSWQTIKPRWLPSVQPPRQPWTPQDRSESSWVPAYSSQDSWGNPLIYCCSSQGS